MIKKLLDFIQSNSPDGGFLQSDYWRKFQESYRRKAYDVSASDDGGEPVAYANIIIHTLPIVGDYFYVPRGPVMKVQSSKFKVQSFFEDLITLAKKNDIGWVRVELNSERELRLIKENLPSGSKVKKSSVDVQPREILVLDVTKSEEEILVQMKQKTRYNIRLAEKRGVKVFSVNNDQGSMINRFLELVRITAKRDKIKAHPESYYRKMFEVIPPEILRLYVAEYQGKIISANIVSFFGKTATYMHGASDNEHRNVMAPYLLQWRQILDAREAGLTQYDFGGIKSCNTKHATCNKNSWTGITKFKTGFAPGVEPIKFPGCWDIVLKPTKYWLYRILRKIKP